jgi:hypothetical protein
MDEHRHRTLTTQLAEDLGWLEQNCRQHPDQSMQAVQLRLASALVRNCIGPFLDDQPARPLHIAVLGGAGAGKSTVANMLSGNAAAEANPQAGFTRHPIAFTSANGHIHWPDHVGFLGPLRLLSDQSPSNLDEDVYQVRRVPMDEHSQVLLQNFVVWDCPDMTTWASTGYVPRLLEVAGLADVIVYVASDERYNDEVPTEFLRLLLQAGKPVVCCLMKMREKDAPAFVSHFQQAVLSRMPAGTVACLAIPQLNASQLADPARQAPQYRIPLLNQVAVMGEQPDATRRRVVRTATNYLISSADALTAAARGDLAALEEWRRLVEIGRNEFEERYRREYLNSEKFRRFDEALVRLLELLELPGVGRLVSQTLYVVRTPYRLLKGFISRAMSRPESVNMPELPVLEGALAGWTDYLRKEALRRSGNHPVWAHINRGFDHGLSNEIHSRFQRGFHNFQLGMADEIEKTARALYEDIEKNPAVLNTLRGSKFALEVASIAGVVAAGGINWTDVILVPLAAAVTQHLVEWLGKQYVDTQREQARMRQLQLVQRYVSQPLGEWLIQWPATGGSEYERLQTALRRIPAAVEELNDLVTRKLAETTA